MTDPDREMIREAVRTVLGDNVRVARARARLSQEKVASGMRERGFDTWSRVTVSEIERYNRPVTVEELVGLASVFGTHVSDLMSGAKWVEDTRRPADEGS